MQQHIHEWILGATLAGALAFGVAAQTAPAPESQIVNEFSGWAGSTQNATALVQGLRAGTPITLTTPTPGPAVSTTFAPGTQPMGYGNINIALSLARAELASQGITQPTALQLQSALVGVAAPGTGILSMRAAGMGWGKIANELGFKLGPVVSGKQTVTPTTAPQARGSGKGPAATAAANTGRGHSAISSTSGNRGGGATHSVAAQGGSMSAHGNSQGQGGGHGGGHGGGNGGGAGGAGGGGGGGGR